MNKFFTKIASAVLGLAMAIGVGTVIASNLKEVKVAEAAETVEATLSFANKAQRTSYSTTGQVWEQNGITFTNNKASSTNDVADYAGPVRLYANSSVTVAAPGKISQIVFDTNAAKYTTPLQNSIGTTATTSVSSDKVTVSLNGGKESFSITKLTAQVRLDSLTVTYTSGTTEISPEWETTAVAISATSEITATIYNNDTSFPTLSGVTVTKTETDNNEVEEDRTLPVENAIFNWVDATDNSALSLPLETTGTYDCKVYASIDGITLTSKDNKDESLRYIDVILNVIEAPKFISIAYSGSTTNMSGENDADKFKVSSTDWSIIGYKNNASNNVGLNKDGEIRLYGSANGGNYFCVNALKPNINITEIVINLKDNTSTNYKVYEGVENTSGSDVSNDGGKFLFNAGVTGFTIINTNSGTTQVVIKEIIAYYEEVENSATTYSVEFDSNGGSLVDPLVVNSGEKFEFPSTSREGYAFKGWKTEGDNTDYQIGDISPAVVGNITYVANWEQNENPEPDPEPDPGTPETTSVQTSIGDYAVSHGWGNSTQYNEILMDDNITVTASGGGNTGKYYSSDNTWRIYQTESPSLTISTNSEKILIISVSITYKISNSGTLTLNGGFIGSEEVVNANDDIITFNVGNTKTATNGQVQITSITVVYSDVQPGETPDPEPDPGTPEVTTTITTNIAEYADKNSWADTQKYSDVVMDDNITATASSGGSNTGKYYENGENWRVYQTESNASLTISSGNGKTIISLKITYDSDKGGALTLNGQNVESATLVNVNDSSIIFKMGNTGTATNGQARITEIEVIYEDDVLVVSSFIKNFMNFDIVEHNPDSALEINNKMECGDLYQAAKTEFNAFSKSQKTLFCNGEDYQNARDRLSAWARANGDELNLSDYSISSQSSRFMAIVNKDNGAAVLIVTVSLISVAAIGGYFFLKKRKEQ